MRDPEHIIRTVAGQTLLAAFSINERDEHGEVIGHVFREDPCPLVAAIEAEAVASYLASPEFAERLAGAMKATKVMVTDGVHSAGPLHAVYDPHAIQRKLREQPARQSPGEAP